MTILIIGASGYVGRHLSDELLEKGHRLIVSSRDTSNARKRMARGMEFFEWNGKDASVLARALENVDAVVNLAGVSLASGRWTRRRKHTFYESRVTTGMALAEAFRLSNSRPSLLIQSSASGIYGPDATVADGERRPTGQGYLAELCLHWENSVRPVEELGVRVVYLRTGPILGHDSPFVKKLLLPFRFGMGVVLGNGRQWLPWVHIRDVTGAIRFLLAKTNARGPFNITAPEPVSMRNFMKAIGKIRKQPAWLTLPAFLLKLMFGEMARETILASQDILPEALLDAGYSFQYPDIHLALDDILRKNEL